MSQSPIRQSASAAQESGHQVDTTSERHGNNTTGQPRAFLQRFHGVITSQERMQIFQQKPVTIWLTGLSGAGKSTIAFELEQQLVSLGHACYVLDGDNIRHGLASDLGFAQEDRRENIRRVAHVAQLMNDAGLIVITALISPMREDRAMAREIIGPGKFIETYLPASLDACAQRDPKGLYAKARAGEIASFTGVSAPYEAPVDPELQIDSTTLTPGESVAGIFAYLRQHCLVMADQERAA